MMNAHRSSTARRLGGGAAVLTLAAASLTLGSAGAAHPHPDGDEQRREHRILILEKGGDGERSAHREGRVREFSLRRGENGEIELPENCREGGSEVFNHSTQDGDQRTRFILCSRSEASPAQRIEMLENAKRRLGDSEHLGAEHRARIVARLDEEIARLRAQ